MHDTATDASRAQLDADRPLPGERRKVDVGGLEMNVCIAGSGPDVLLVHGFPDTHRVWRRQIRPLVEAGYRVVAPDTRGRGETELKPDVSDYRLEHLVADLVGLLDALEIARARIVAHDWGAVIAWQLAIAYPERVERLIVLSVGHPASYAGAGLPQRLRGWYTLFFQLRGISEALLRWRSWHGLRMLLQDQDEADVWTRDLSRPGRLTAALNYYRANMRMLLDVRAQRRFVDVPVHAIWSSGDRFLTESQMRDSQRFVRAPWTYTRIEGANHWLQLRAPERLNRCLLEYLS